MKIILSASPSLFFFTKSSQYQIWKANTYYILTNGNRTWTAMSESSTRISMLHDPTDSEQKFHKTRIENWLSTGFELGIPWVRIYSHNHYTMHGLLLISWMRSLKLLSIFKVLEKSWRLFNSLKLYKRFQNPHPVPRAASDPNKTQPYHLLNHLQEKQQKEKFYFSYLVFSKQNIKEILRLHSESCATLRYKATTFCGKNRPNIISNAMYSITIGC